MSHQDRAVDGPEHISAIVRRVVLDVERGLCRRLAADAERLPDCGSPGERRAILDEVDVIVAQLRSMDSEPRAG